MMLEQRAFRLLTGIGSAANFLVCQSAIATPITPSADGTGTQIFVEGNRFDIQGGQLSGDGANLFHSFQEFGLNANQTANFLSQPQIQNILGRVRGGNASFIDGLLQVTGGNSNLYLINPAGILIGPNARLNLPANFTAATATGVGFENGWFDLTTTDYTNLVGTPSLVGFDSAVLGDLVNLGQLTVAEGQALTLLGGTVVNTGELSAPEGNITVSAITPPDGGSGIIRLSPTNGILSLDVQAEMLATGVDLPEALSLPQLITGGTAVSNATGLTVNDAGVAVLSGSGIQIADEAGTTIIAGNVTVAGDMGGDIQVTGNQVGLIAANIDASGVNDGGTALIGGDYQGQGNLPTAEQTYVSADSNINVSSTGSGNAGRAIVWADDATQFYGTVDAQGGQLAGDGGFVEISGARQLAFDGAVLLDATNGAAGSLLLDPELIRIVATGGADDAQLADGSIFAADGGAGSTFTISEQALEALTGSVTLESTNLIEFVSLSDNRLDFQAGEGDVVTFRAPGTAPFGSISFIALDSLTNGGVTIETNGGDLVFDVGDFDGSTAPFNSELSLVSNGGDIEINSDDQISTIQLIDTSSGSRSAGDVNLNAAVQIGGTAGASIVEIDASSTSTVPGNADGGNVTGTTDPDTGEGFRILLANTSSSNGDAGNIEYVSGGVILGGSEFLSFEASAPNGRAGDILLNALGSVDNPSEINGLQTIRALSGTGQGGTVTLRADEIDFEENGIDPVFDVDFGAATPLQISGQLIFEPQSSGQDILVGGSGIVDDPDIGQLDVNGFPLNETLHISAFELNTFSDQPNDEGSFNRADGGVLVRTDGDGTIEFASTLSTQELFIDVTVEGGADSVIVGPDQATDYIILDTGSGIISGFGTDIDGDGVQDTNLRFTNVGTIQAGDLDDSLVFLNDQATFDGNFDGGGGNNVLDFSGDASVSLALSPNGVDGYSQALDVDLTADPAVTLASDPSFVIVEGQVDNITGVTGGSGDDVIFGDANANLLGGGGGNDTINGRGGDDIIEIERDASFELLAAGIAANEIRIDNNNDGTFEESDQISNIEVARFLGGPSDNTFTVGADSWQGPLVLIDGGNGNDTYNIGIDGAGEGSVIVGDTGTTGTDTLTVIGSVMDDDFAVAIADSPNPGGFDPDPIAFLTLPEDANLLARLDEDFVVDANGDVVNNIDGNGTVVVPFSTNEIDLLDNIDILDTEREDIPGQAINPPAYKVSRVNLNTETAAFSGVENVSFDGADGSDTYTATLGAESVENLIDITINDTGTSGTDRLEVSGNQLTNEFGVTLASDPNELSELRFFQPSVFGADNPDNSEIIDFSGLENVRLDGGADTASGAVGDTYTLSLGSPSSITLEIQDSGTTAQGIDTLIIEGTGMTDTLEVGATSITLLETGEQVVYNGIDALGLNTGAGADVITVTESIQFGFGLDLNTGTNGGDILVNGDITVNDDSSTALNTAINAGIVVTTLDGVIDTSGGTLSTTSTMGAADPINLTATGDITTADISASGLTGGAMVSLESNSGNINTGNIDTASVNGRGGAILVDADEVVVGNLATNGRTISGDVAINGGTVVASTINTQGNGGTSQGGAVNIAVSNKLQVTDTFVSSGGTVASISSSGDMASGDITLQFSEEVTFAVGDSSSNGTAGAISANDVLGAGSFSKTFVQGNIRLIIPFDELSVGNGNSSLLSDFQTLITEPSQQLPVPLACIPDSNLSSEEGIQLTSQTQREELNCSYISD